MSFPIRAVVFLAVVVAIVGRAQTASGEGETVGVYRVDIDGVSKTAADKFERSIEEGLTGTGFKVATRKHLRAKLKGHRVQGCYFGACLKRVYKQTKIRIILVARITSAGPNYNFVVSLLDARTGMPTSQVADRCEVCTLEEAIASATLAVVALATGTGTASVSDPVTGPTRSAKPALLRAEISRLSKHIARQKRVVRSNKRIGWLFVGLGVVVSGLGALQVRSCDDRDKATCWIGAGLGGALSLAGTSILLISR